MPKKDVDSRKSWRVFLPSTTFPMKADLKNREPEILKRYQKVFWDKLESVCQNRPEFRLLDGPPYANGSIHMGHALNKILKDIVIKHKLLSGYRALLRPGWDCHGLPIEQKVLSQWPENEPIDPMLLRQRCRETALNWVQVQSQQFQRLGILALWDQPYLTLNSEYVAKELEILALMMDKGLIYRGLRPIYWNPKLQSALADAEVEYHTIQSDAIDVGFTLVGDSRNRAFWGDWIRKGLKVVIWTTTPWTLPSNAAIAFNEQLDYVIVQTPEHGYILVAEALKHRFDGNYAILGKVTGSELQGLEARHPFLERVVPLLPATFVTSDTGTGFVHVAPAHGLEDFELGQKWNLPIYQYVNEQGNFDETISQLKGLFYRKANSIIIDWLSATKALIKHEKIQHSYPHCWRTHEPLIYRLTWQWFLNLQKGQPSILQESLEALTMIQFVPEWGKARFESILKNRPDWCLSRQRVWGVPFPALRHKHEDLTVASGEIARKMASLVRQHGADIIWMLPSSGWVEPSWLPKGTPSDWEWSRDILDVWFDSGVAHWVIYPDSAADLYLEGSDQHRGWFNSSLMTSMAAKGTIPYKTLVTHGFVLVDKGQKMSKSKGNQVDPFEFSQNQGAELLRLWVAHEDFSKDVIWSQQHIQNVTDTYRKFRNVIRFLLGALTGFEASELLPVSNWYPFDRLAYYRLFETGQQVRRFYDEYEFFKVYHTLNQWVTVQLSAHYLDGIKDRLYTWPLNHPGRKSAQSAIWVVAQNLILWLAPILSFLAEEAWDHSPFPKQESVFLLKYPDLQVDSVFDQWVKHESSLNQLRDQVNSEAEKLRQKGLIGSNLEVEVTLQGPLNHLFCGHDEVFWREFFNVSRVQLQTSNQWSLQVHIAEGVKCPRCWKVFESLLPSGLCQMCHEAELSIDS